MWYEVEMFPEYIDSCIQMMEGIENPENVTFHFCLNFQEYLEKCQDIYFATSEIVMEWLDYIQQRMQEYLKSLSATRCQIRTQRYSKYDSFYNIAAYRRELNYNWCNQVDFVLWGETDSLWPKQTLEIIEGITSQEYYPKFILNFAGRKNWDASWDIITHPLYENETFVDNDEWVLENEASEKSYMTLDRMNEINNIPFDHVRIQLLEQPKADGSCLVISSDLIKSGVNIPHALIHCGEDESFMRMAKLIMGEQFVQYNVKNILRVHNRRHPRKRMYIKDENNPKGFCDERKGDWWKILEDSSKKNLDNLRNQVKFIKQEDVLQTITEIR